MERNESAEIEHAARQDRFSTSALVSQRGNEQNESQPDPMDWHRRKDKNICAFIS
jgi:hypothetical protein